MPNGSRGFVVVTEATRTAALDALPVVSVDDYLEGPPSVSGEDLVIVNLCRSYQYLSKGYYVSLLADARHQRVFPTLKMIEEIRNTTTTLQMLREAGVETVDPRTVRELRRAAPKVAVGAGSDTGARSGAPFGNGDTGEGDAESPALRSGYAETWCVFGKTTDDRFRRHCAAIFARYAFPILKLRFYRDEGLWKVGSLQPASLGQLDPAEIDVLVRELSRPQVGTPHRSAPGPRPHRIACLWDADDPLAASDRETLDRMSRIAARRGVLFERIGREDLARLAEYDALFIRTVTAIEHFSFTFAQAAENLGIPVIDDPQSIVKCSNKVYLQELFRRNGIPTPRTMTISRKTPAEELRTFGFPLIVKLPDGTFSQAVKKADDEKALEAITQEMFKRSPLLIVQEFIPTPFDWRVGMLDGRVLFVCKYHMARGHWQIVSLGRNGGRRYGKVEAVAREDVPQTVLDVALESTALLGDGLYGVDLKETSAGPVVIEINDNPNILTTDEDGVERDRVYEALLDAFVARIRSSVVAAEEAS